MLAKYLYSIVQLEENIIAIFKKTGLIEIDTPP
jgi:hypothetical protein